MRPSLEPAASLAHTQASAWGGEGEPVSCTPQEHAPPLAGARRKRGADWLGGSRGFQPPRRRARGAETQFKRRSGGSSGAGPGVSSALHPFLRTQIRHGRYWFGALFSILPPAPEKPRTGLGRFRIGGVLRQLLRTLYRGLAPSWDTEPPEEWRQPGLPPNSGPEGEAGKPGKLWSRERRKSNLLGLQTLLLSGI